MENFWLKRRRLREEKNKIEKINSIVKGVVNAKLLKNKLKGKLWRPSKIKK